MTFVLQRLSTSYERFRHPLHVLLILLLVLISYGQSLDYGFVWDDHQLIVDNPKIKSVESIRQVLTNDFWNVGYGRRDDTRGFYRPLITLSYLADYSIWGLNPKGYHLTNVIAHAIASVLAYFLALILLRRPTHALLSAVLFAVHPTHVESVCWISGRTDVFCGVFFLLAWIAVLRLLETSRPSPGWLTVTVGAYLAALLCKETAL